MGFTWSIILVARIVDILATLEIGALSVRGPVGRRRIGGKLSGILMLSIDFRLISQSLKMDKFF